MADNQEQILDALRAQNRILERIEKHLRPKVADALPIHRPNIHEPAVGHRGVYYTTVQESSSVPDLPPGVEPMSEDDYPWHPGFPAIPLTRP